MSFIYDRQLGALALLATLGTACTGMVGGSNPDGQAASPAGPTGGLGGSASTVGSSGSSSAGVATTAGSGAGGAATGPLSTGGVTLRVLTEAEYRASIQALFGAVTAQLTLPVDSSFAGFISVGAAQLTVNDPSVTAYEAASRAITAEVFGDTQRWQTLVGCQPKADLSDACVSTFIQTFGKRAFRRDLTAEELQSWLGVAQAAAQLAGKAADGLAAATSGLLQSPNFLYRVETNKLDPSNGRLKYDGLSMATRLSYMLSGGPPSATLLAAAASGQLDTADGIRAAAAPLLMDAGAVDHMAAFFSEFAQAQLVLKKEKSAQLFPAYTPALQSSMLQGTQLFIKNVVLAPNADVRSFYNSNQTFADALLAPIYGVAAPASGFSQITLGPDTGRAGILGQASVIAAQSQPDKNSPTRRGVFIVQALLCTTPSPPPAGVNTMLPTDTTTTARQKLEAHRTNPSCKACHALFDPLGLALEHFDAIGQYRATENGLTIDTTGMWNGAAFDGAAQLGAVLGQDPMALNCMMRNFYRDMNGRIDDMTDATQIDSLIQSLTTHNYAWRDLVADFVASDAFRSAPALPVVSQ